MIMPPKNSMPAPIARIGTHTGNANRHPGAPDCPRRLTEEQKRQQALTAAQKATKQKVSAKAVKKAAQIEDQLYQEDLKCSTNACHPKAMNAKPPIVKKNQPGQKGSNVPPQ